jgi:hypothetical protein
MILAVIGTKNTFPNGYFYAISIFAIVDEMASATCYLWWSRPN